MSKVRMYGMQSTYIPKTGNHKKAPWQGAHKKIKPPKENTCVCCGDKIPEGRQVCPSCEKNTKENETTELIYGSSPCTRLPITRKGFRE